jgi:hypothetical protein
MSDNTQDDFTIALYEVQSARNRNEAAKLDLAAATTAAATAYKVYARATEAEGRAKTTAAATNVAFKTARATFNLISA